MTTQELQTVLAISRTIATIRKKSELLQLIIEQLQPLFGFYDCGLFVFNRDKTTLEDWAVSMPTISPSEANVLLAQQHAAVFTYSGSVFEWVFDRLRSTNAPFIHNYEDQVPGWVNYIQASVIDTIGYEESMVAVLQTGGDEIGVFMVNSLQKGTFQKDQCILYQAIADQVAGAVANILANEEILEREWEKSQLLEISQAIARVQNHKQLLKVIYEKIKPLFPYDNAGLFVFDKTGEWFRELLDTAVLADAVQTELTATLDLGPFPVAGHHPKAWHYAQSPVICSLAEQAQYFDALDISQQFEVGLRHGLQQMIGGPLTCGGRKIGLISFNTKDSNFYSQQHIPLFQAIADQIAVAVANILANEEILEREREKSVLLSISENIASVRDKVDLLKVIIEKIKPLFGFYDCGILVIDEENRFHDLAVIHPHIDDSEVNHKLNKLGFFQDSGLDYANSGLEWIIRQLERTKSPVLFDYTIEHAIFSDSSILATIRGLGYQEAVCGLLKAGGSTLGCFTINYKRKQQANQVDLALFQNVVDQLSVAVANILANEEILQREQEKSVLLSISEDIASARNTVELLSVIREKARNLIPFYNTGVIIVEEGGQYHYDLAVTIPVWDDSEGNRKLSEAGLHRIVHPNSYIDYVMKLLKERQAPIIEDYELRFKQFDYPFFPVVKEVGAKEGLVALLRTRGKTFGTLWLNSLQTGSYHSKQFEIFQALADQVAVAVDNILANEEILRREQEKSNLLAISTAIATIRDKDDLFRVITDTVRPILGFDEAAQIFAIDPTDQTIGIFLRNTSGMISQDADYQQLTRQRFAIAGSPFEKILAWPTVYVLDPAQEAKHYPHYPGFPIMVRMGIRQSMITPLRYGGRIIGTFHVFSTRADFFGPQHFAFFETVANQIAVAVANILANEELLRRESEKALQLAVSNSLADEHDWDQKLLTLVKTIQPAIPFDYAILGLETGGPIRHGYGFYRTGPDEYQTLLADDFLQLSRLTAEQYSQMRQQLNDSQPLLLNGADFEQHCRQFALKQLISQTFRLQSHLLFPIPLTREGRFTLAFYSRQADTYRSYHLDLFQKLRPTLALTLDRLLAYEEVAALSQQLQQENTYLQEEVLTNYRFEEIVGTSQAVRDVFQKVGKVGPMSSTVLILGETGTGKELVARAIHQASPRQAKPLIKINCAALPAQLIESELFGHEKGAFTGAIERRIGKFELAHESTIFLDEIGELPLELQAKLLRAIQEKEIERLGSNKVIQTDVRVLAATNRNLEKEVAEGRFRSDLYFRLNVYPIKLPPLRERKEDITLLAVHFSQKLSKKLGKAINGFSNGAIKEMQAYHWPGNIRELEHVIERAAIESEGGTIRNLGLLKRPEGELTVMINPSFQLKSYADGERELIMNTVRYCNGRIRGTGGAAQLLQVKATTLEARMKKLGIKREFFVNEGAGGSATR